MRDRIWFFECGIGTLYDGDGTQYELDDLGQLHLWAEHQRLEPSTPATTPAKVRCDIDGLFRLHHAGAQAESVQPADTQLLDFVADALPGIGPVWAIRWYPERLWWREVPLRSGEPESLPLIRRSRAR